MKKELYFFLNNSGTIVVSDRMPRFGVRGELITDIPQCAWTAISRDGMKLFGIKSVPKDRVVRVVVDMDEPEMSQIERKVIATEFVPVSAMEVVRKPNKGETVLHPPGDEDEEDLNDPVDDDFDDEEVDEEEED